MSKIKSSITDIIGDGIDTYIYTTTATNRPTWLTDPTHTQCYDWLKEAYPEIFKEFEAIQDIQRGINV